jgi:hypothetical protein
MSDVTSKFVAGWRSKKQPDGCQCLTQCHLFALTAECQITVSSSCHPRIRMMRTEFGLGGFELVADWVIEMVERWNQTINQWICRVEASWFSLMDKGTRSTILGFYGIRWVCFYIFTISLSSLPQTSPSVSPFVVLLLLPRLIINIATPCFCFSACACVCVGVFV